MDQPLSQSMQSQAEPAGPEPILDWVGDGFFVVDHQYKILHANAESCRLLRRDAGSLVGQSLLDLFDGSERKFIESLFGQSPNDGPPERIVVPMLRGDQLCQFELTIYSRPGGFGVLLRDVSQWIYQERRIAELNATLLASQELLRRKNDEMNVSLEQLEKLNRQLEEMDRAKNEFLAVTSHELRTPLNSIIGFMQLIAEGLCENRQEEMSYIDNALASARRLLAMINDVLDIAKIEAGKMTLVIADMDVEELFNDVGGTIIVQAQRKELALSFRIEGQQPLRVRADAQKARQILLNLIGNAVKFTTKGSVSVTARRDEARPDLIRFTVQDTGIGIPAHYLTRIFDKFIQVDPTSTRKYEGTGLGLTITRNLVEIMGGTIEAHSDGENLGTTMTFTLPTGGEQRRQPDGVELASDEMEALLPSTF
ncbi:PAS domain-containing protein [bacterium]|nr:PAS domain-containing protein [bacterium]